MTQIKDYRPEDFGQKEVDMIKLFKYQLDDAKRYFDACLKPRYDRSYKLYIAYNGDRADEIKKYGKRWQANYFVPYVQSVVETLKPRILDARPEFGVQGRTIEDQPKSMKLEQLGDYNWEISEMDSVNEMIVHSSLVYGMGFMYVYWKKDVRSLKFLKSNDLSKRKLAWKKEEKVFYDAPFAEAVDPYELLYDWHNIDRRNKLFWFRRKILSGASIKRMFTEADPQRLEMALQNRRGDLTDWAAVRNQVKLTHEDTVKGADYSQNSASIDSGRYTQYDSEDVDNRLYEVYLWHRPLDDFYSVMVNEVPILKNGFMPIPYDFKEINYIDIPYLRAIGEFEGYGLPMLLESPQLMLNMIKNQRLDAMTLNIHKMWIVNPLANINKEELITRPFGIIYSPDPNGVREVQFSDIKPSAYREEELIKGDMRYTSGVDDFSMGVSGSAGSATEVRHLRESTLERVRLYINHLGDAYGNLLRYWISMWRQFYTDNIIIRIVGESGNVEFPIIQKDDLKGEFDFKATVLPSIAGQNDVEKKQAMDLFQLLVQMPFVDPERLVSKVLYPWKWSLEDLRKIEEQQPMLPPGTMPGAEGQQFSGMPLGKNIPANIGKEVEALLGGGQAGGASPFREAAAPINLLGNTAGPPPTVQGIGKTNNLAGFNRGGKVNTNIPMKPTSSPESQLMNQAGNIQR